MVALLPLIAFSSLTPSCALEKGVLTRQNATTAQQNAAVR
jgi:hypothetical protein